MMTDDERLEAVARAICIHGLVGRRLISVLREGIDVTDTHREQAAAAIAEHSAYLRERSKDADVVEAVDTAMREYTTHPDRLVDGYDFLIRSGIALTAALDAMIGKEQGDE